MRDIAANPDKAGPPDMGEAVPDYLMGAFDAMEWIDFLRWAGWQDERVLDEQPDVAVHHRRLVYTYKRKWGVLD